MKLTQEMVESWQNKTFGNITPETRLQKVVEEMVEFSETPNEEEAADVLITLFGYAAACGFDLLEVGYKKHRENESNRVWELQPDGSWSRVRS